MHCQSHLSGPPPVSGGVSLQPAEQSRIDDPEFAPATLSISSFVRVRFRSWATRVKVFMIHLLGVCDVNKIPQRGAMGNQKKANVNFFCSSAPVIACAGTQFSIGIQGGGYSRCALIWPLALPERAGISSAALARNRPSVAREDQENEPVRVRTRLRRGESATARPQL
jgi:hypothetical protein